ncbi:hypothetical protein C8R43DRAFT_175816 [Mycena crocata]|nr:hypothetical protein C8R43DRAFT_175816 [Mycena crocata]
MDVDSEEREERGSSGSPTITFNEFPFDTLIHIQSFMAPIDIISLRRTSKTMASATRHRTVWMNALRRVCAAHEVSMLTYPLEKMTLADLEHAATSPGRFIAQISKDRATDDLIPAFSTRLFEPPSDFGEVCQMRIIPGGRYLVTSSSTARLCVWDLGYGPAAVINPCPLASIGLPSAGVDELPTELLIQPTQNNHGFRLLVFYPLGLAAVDVMVFEIYPAAAQPTFATLAKRRIFSPKLKTWALSRDRFTFHYDFCITVWDFVEDACATVHVYDHVLNMSVSQGAIICQHAEGISVLDMPPLHPSGTPAAEAVVEPVTPLPTVSHIHAVFEHTADLVASQADWHSAPDVPVVLDVFGLLVDGSNAYARCIVKPVAGGEDTDLPSALPVLMGVSRVPSETFDADFYGRLHLAGTHIVRTWPTGSSIMVNAARIPTQRQIEFTSNTGWLWELPNVEAGWVYDLDTMSGRLATLAADTEIRILDYMLPNV